MKPKTSSQPTLINATMLAKRLKCNRATIYQWVKDGMPGGNVEGNYNYEECLQWLTLRQSQKVATHEAVKHSQSLKDKRLEAQIEKLNLENEILKGNYIPLDVVKKETQRHILAAKSILLGLGSKLAAQVTGLKPAEAQRLIEEEVLDAMGRISEGEWK